MGWGWLPEAVLDSSCMMLVDAVLSVVACQDRSKKGESQPRGAGLFPVSPGGNGTIRSENTQSDTGVCEQKRQSKPYEFTGFRAMDVTITI